MASSDVTNPRGRGIMNVDVGIAPIMHAWNPTVTLTWDAEGNLTSMRETDGTDTFDLGFTWDAEGNLTNIGPWTEG
jgi:YD repeat-containing protein